MHVLISNFDEVNDAFAAQNILKQLQSLEFAMQVVEENSEEIFKILRSVSLLIR